MNFSVNNIALSYESVLGSRYLRVPSKRVAIVSRKVFWGASSPLRTGIPRTAHPAHTTLHLRTNMKKKLTNNYKKMYILKISLSSTWARVPAVDPYVRCWMFYTRSWLMAVLLSIPSVTKLIDDSWNSVRA